MGMRVRRICWSSCHVSLCEKWCNKIISLYVDRSKGLGFHAWYWLNDLSKCKFFFFFFYDKRKDKLHFSFRIVEEIIFNFSLQTKIIFLKKIQLMFCNLTLSALIWLCSYWSLIIKHAHALPACKSCLFWM